MFKSIKEDGNTSLITIFLVLILISVCLYNMNIAKTSYFTTDLKHQFDSIAEERILKVIDKDKLKKYEFGDSNYYYKYNETTKNMDIIGTSYDLSNLKTYLISNIKTDFEKVLPNGSSIVKWDKTNVEFNCKEISNNFLNKTVYVPYISFSYSVVIEVPIIGSTPLRTGNFKIEDRDISSGSYTVTKSSRNGYVNIAFSGKSSVKYNIYK